MYLYAVDLGTTGCKAIVFDKSGRELASHYIEYPLILGASGEVEQDAELWWKLCCKVLQEVRVKADIPNGAPCALGISSQGISFVPLDASGQVLSNAFCWLDTRAGAEVQEFLKEIPDAFAITAKRPLSSYSLPKILWFQKHRPELFAKTAHLPLALDYLVYRLTGRFVTDHSMAGGTLLYDLQKQTWSDRILDTFSLDRSLFSELHWCDEPAGTLTPEAVAETGLPDHCVVAVGGQDQKVAAYGAQLDTDTLTLSMGTCAAFEFLTDRPVFDPEQAMPCFSYLPDSYTVEACINASGASLKWLRNTFFPTTRYPELDAKAAKAPCGSNGIFFYPHLAGAGTPIGDDSATGSFLGLTLSSTAGDIARSVLEGVAFQIEENIRAAKRLGCHPKQIKIFGGGAQSPLWCQIIADVTGLNVTAFASPECGCRGAAMLAYKAATGRYAEQFANSSLLDAKEYRPGKAHTYYTTYYTSYRQKEMLVLQAGML